MTIGAFIDAHLNEHVLRSDFKIRTFKRRKGVGAAAIEQGVRRLDRYGLPCSFAGESVVLISDVY